MRRLRNRQIHQRAPARSFERQVMRRVRIVIALVFLLITVGTILDVQAVGRARLGDNSSVSLNVLERGLRRELNVPAADLNALASSGEARAFAQTLSELSVNILRNNELDEQTALLQSFENLLQARSPDYLSLRLLTPSGGRWLYVEMDGGMVAIDDQYLAQPSVLPTLRSVQNAISPGEVWVGPATPETATEPASLLLYAPVAGTQNVNVARVVIELRVALAPFQSVLLEHLDDESIAEPGRRVLLADANNNLLLDYGPAHHESALLRVFLDTQDETFINTRFENDWLLSGMTVTTLPGINTPWRVILVDDYASAIARLNAVSAAIGISLLIAGVLTITLVQAFLRPVMRPLADLTSRATALAQDHSPDPTLAADQPETLVMEGGTAGNLPVPGRADELSTLAGTLDGLTGRIEALHRDIRKQSDTRQRDMDLVTRLNRTTAALADIDVLLERGVSMICGTLDYQHAEVYIVDDVGMNAVRTYSRRGENNRTKVLPLNGTTPIAEAINSQQSVVSPTLANTGLEPGNEDLNALVTLPLIVGERIIGALNLYSHQPHAFPESDLPVLRLLADQLAVAVHNARLARQTAERVERINVLNRQLTRAGWENSSVMQAAKKGFRYDLQEISQLDEDDQPGAVSSPIVIRGETIGTLSANPGEGQSLSAGETVILQAVASRVALAIENARLFQETQLSLAETSTLYQLSRYLNEATTLEEIVEAIIVAVMPDANGGQVWVFDNDNPDVAPQTHLVLEADHAANGGEERQLVGLTFNVNDHAFLRDLHINRVSLIQHVGEDNRLSEALRDLFDDVEAQSVIIIPLVVRSNWHGMVCITFDHPRTFSEQESGIYSALIDQAAVAIDNRLLMRSTADMLERNENLYAASRMINQAQNAQELVRAIASTSAHPHLIYSLALFEGDLDRTGWPSQFRLVAQSAGTMVHPRNEVYPIGIAAESPMRRREPEVWSLDEGSVTGSDDGSPDDFPAWMHARGYRFLAVFPLFSANQPIALFTIASHRPHNLSVRDEESYLALTGQMSTQLQIRSLLERTELALDETRRLYEASRGIASASDTRDIYQVATEHLTRPLLQIGVGAADMISLKMLVTAADTARGTAHLQIAYAWDSEFHGMSDATGELLDSRTFPYKRLVQQADDLLYFHDITDVGDLEPALAAEPELRARLLQDGVRSLVAVAIQSRMRWFGIVVVESSRVAAFSEQYQRFLMAVADQIGIAVENKALFREAQLEAERAQAEAQRALALAEASQFANRIGANFELSLNEVFERVSQAAGFNRWLLALFDENRTLLRMTIARLPDAETGDDVTYDLVTPLPLTLAAIHNQPFIANRMRDYLPDDDDEMLDAFDHFFGKHIAAPVTTGELGETVLGAVILGRNLDSEDLDERDESLVVTLAAQVAVALENRRLFQQAETEQNRLQSVLATMPAGILVLDPHTLQPRMHNEQAAVYLGRAIDTSAPFDCGLYNLYRTGTNMLYPREEMPIFVALETDTPTFSDDVAVLRQGDQIDLMVNAAPIHDSTGRTTAIVAAFQDISNLRGLENTLQENLRETVALYEAQRQLAAAGDLDEVLNVIVEQLFMMQPDEGLLISANGFTDDEDLPPRVERYLMLPVDDPQPFMPVLDPYDMVVIHDIAAHNALPAVTREAFAERGIYGFVSVPLRTRQHQLGWLVMMTSEADGITSEQERILSQLGDVASTAIDNRLLIRSQEQAVREIGVLYNATATISRTDDLQQLAVVLQAAVMSMHPTAAWAFLNPYLREGHDDTTPLFVAGADQVDVESLRTYGISTEAPEGGIFIEDLIAFREEDQAAQVNMPEALVEGLLAQGIRAVGAVNLRVKDQVGGRIIVVYDEPHKFRENDVRYLNTIVDSASVVVDNILLFERIQAALHQTNILYQAGRALTNAVSEKDILEVLKEYLIQPPTDYVFIGLLEGRSWDTPGAQLKIAADWHIDGTMALTDMRLDREEFPAWPLLTTGDLLAVEDVLADERLDEMTAIGVQGLDLRSVLVLPLRVSQREIGILWVGAKVPRSYTERDLQTYRAFAEQASLSMEASYLLMQTERRARQLKTSAAVSESASQILDLEVLLPRVVDLIKRSFEYDHVQVFLMDERDEWAVLRASTGEAGQKLLGIRHRLAKGSSSVIGQVTATGEATIALDTADADVVHKPNQYLPMTRSEMALPLIIKGRVVGALDVQSNEPNAFGEEDLDALTTLAAQISVAIDNANNYAGTQRQAERMSFLFDTTTAAASAAADSLDEALTSVARELHRAYNAAAAIIYLPRHYMDLDENTYTTLQVAALVGSDQPLSEIEELRADDPTPLLSAAYREGQPVIVDRISEQPRYLPVAEDARSMMVVPLVTGAQVVGVIVVESAHEYAYDEDALRLLRTLAGSLSAVVQSALLLEQLTATNEQLRELDRVKSDFLANMSHELRTPLNSIIGFSRVMLKGIDGPLTEMQEQDLTTIFTSGQHLLTLINDVLDQAKIASGKMEIKPDYFEVKPLVEAVKSIGIGLVKDNGVNLHVEYAPNLPLAYGDEFRTRQVLINLVSNASKFTSAGGITLRAYTEPHPTTGATMVRIDVVDTGIGIAQKDLPLLFEPFRQVDSSLTRTAGGTGLGLPIAKSLVELQGGQMTVSSTVNAGSTFSITIPVEPPPEGAGADAGEAMVDDDLDADTLPETNGASASANGHGDEPAVAHDGGSDEDKPASQPTVRVPIMTKATATQPMTALPPKRDIVLIEDNKDMVDQFRRILQREGFEVQVADHPAYAEAMVGNLRPTVIVMDVNFAQGQGWDILARLKGRDDTADIPVIVVTLSADSDQAREMGAFAFVPRPFLPDDLVSVVLDAETANNVQRVLIIDDDPEQTETLENLLALADAYRVYSCRGLEGMSQVAHRQPDLIVINPVLENIDGLSLLTELRTHPETASIPLIVISAENLQPQAAGTLDNVGFVAPESLVPGSSADFLREVKARLVR